MVVYVDMWIANVECALLLIAIDMRRINMLFRQLKANEIEVRIDRITAKGVWLLLYKNARVDMALLDEAVGEMGWKREHSVVNNNLFCTISIKDKESGEWVSKQDVGVESFTAKEKGEASDAFKRAATCWGIGRELYSVPNIFILCKTVHKENGNGYDLAEKYTFNGIRVSHIEYRNNEISELAIVDKKGNVIYSSLGTSKVPIDPTESQNEDVDLDMRINENHKKALIKRIDELKLTEKKVCDAYQIGSLSEMTIVQLSNCNLQLNGIAEKRKRKKEDEGEIE